MLMEKFHQHIQYHHLVNLQNFHVKTLGPKLLFYVMYIARIMAHSSILRDAVHSTLLIVSCVMRDAVHSTMRHASHPSHNMSCGILHIGCKEKLTSSEIDSNGLDGRPVF